MNPLWYLLLIPGIPAVIILFSLACAGFVDPKKDYPAESRFYRWLLNAWTAIVLFCAGIRLDVEGMEQVPDGPILVVGNHRSNFDPIIAWHVFKKHRLTFISKEANFHIPMFGRYIHRLRFMAIDRENPREAIKTLHAAAELLEEGAVSVGVYPEGTRNKTEAPLLPFHHGVLKIAQWAHTPIVVVTMQNTAAVAHRFPWKTTRVKVKVSGVLLPEEIEGQSTAHIGETVEQTILKDL